MKKGVRSMKLVLIICKVTPKLSLKKKQPMICHDELGKK